MQVSDLVQTLLHKRGITDLEEQEKFLHPDYERDTHDPFLMHDMHRAVERIFGAMKNNEMIAVYGDFDCDGIPGTAVVLNFFKKIGYEHVTYHIPHRDREGYGFHASAIDTLKEKNVSVIITVDVGTVAVESIAYAQSLGIDVIVTDHHEILSRVPPAYALVNPKVKDEKGNFVYPFADLCGAGVAYKLVQALLVHGRQTGHETIMRIPEGWEKWLLDLVAIATIADMVPLVEENRTLAYWGLEVLRKTRRAGLVALGALLKLRRENITEDDIGFSFAPRINAASRMGEPEIALELLITEDGTRAEQLAHELESLNASRKGVVSALVKDIRKKIKARYTDEDRVVVLGDPSWKPALLGLAAQSIIADRGGVALLWGKDAQGNFKGSVRSDGTYTIPQLFHAAGGAVEQYGGHTLSGGFSISADRIYSFAEDIAAVVSSLVPTVQVPKEIRGDHTLAVKEVGISLLRDIAQLAPFGTGNPKPILHVTHSTISGVRPFGKEKNHIEVTIADTHSDVSVRGYDFFRSVSDFSCKVSDTMQAHVLATLERDAYRGGIALRIIDIVQM